ncbi:hypothetical protein P4474_04760 [Geobacillus stearothermophilus]|uniref:hypothetical protein n=1 Tax=Geobacillus stearothermophilus TaxID=1422 RepID=UPI002E1EAF74|nr:hypothetical protein [Geobacillus stearothermophilus]
MDKKKAVKLATASAVAASAFVAANPHTSQAATDVATVVSQAKAQMKQAYYTYSHTVTETGKLPNINDVYDAYNKAKKAYANAVAVVNKAGGAKKDAYLADLQDAYETYVFKANPKSGEARVATYIDAYNYAVKLDGLRQDLAKAVEEKDLKKAEEFYHKISYELRTRTVILDRVYGQTTRELLRSQFKDEAQKLRDRLIYDITVAMKAREAQDAVKAGNLDKAKAALDQVNQYVSKVTDAFKAELQKAAKEANAAYEAALTPKVESVSAINAKTLKVTFNKAVDDTKAKFEVKKGSVTVNVAKTTFSADKKSVELELASKLFEGEYTVNVTGLADQALTGSVKVENEKVAKIELLGEVAPVVVAKDGTKKTATVAYRVFNQYGEDITKSPLASSIGWTASNGVTAQDDDKGILTLTNTSDFKTGDKVAITGINVSTNTVVSGVVTISDASATDTVEFVGIYNKDGKEFSGDLAVGDFVLLLNAKDQYGNVVNASKVNGDVVFTSSNPSVLAIDKAYDGQGKDKDKIGLKFTAGPNYANGGKVIITAISKTSGKVAQFEVNVKAAPALDTFTLGTPTEIVAAGEKVKLPFTAVDQYGNTVTKYEALEGKVTFNTNKAKLVKDASGNAVLEYTAPDTKGLQVLVATVVGSGKVSQLTIDVKEAAYAATIESLKDVTTTVAKDGKVEISLSNLVVKDQYGRTFDLKDKLTNTANNNLGKYKIVVTDSEKGAVKVAENGTKAEITANDGKITITGLEKGSEEVTFELQRVEKNANDTYEFKGVATSPLKVTFNTIEKSAFTSFEIGEIGKLYADGNESTHAKALKVYGVKADGTKVELPSNYYNVIVDSNVLAFTDGKLDVKLTNGDNKFGTKDEITTKVTVIVEGAEAPVTLTKDIVVSKVAPKADKIEFTDAVKNGVASIAVGKLNDNNDAADLSAVLKVTDQYGVKIANPAPIITVTNIKEKTVDTDPAQRFKVDGNGTDRVDIQKVEAGDTFTVTYVLDGKTATVKFTVTE